MTQEKGGSVFVATCVVLASVALVGVLAIVLPDITPSWLLPADDAESGARAGQGARDPFDGARMPASSSAPPVRASEARAPAPVARVDGPETPAAAPPPGAKPTGVVPDRATALDMLRRRQLDVPVPGVARTALRGSFDEARGAGSRPHEAMDIMAARGTPVLAVEDGRVARLFTSKAGGLTIYQFDPDALFVYYYAHLDRYAEGLAEGSTVRRGQVIGYVGSTGNASSDAPHLHFAIAVLTVDKRWWEAAAIDPYLVFGNTE